MKKYRRRFVLITISVFIFLYFLIFVLIYSPLKCSDSTLHIDNNQQFPSWEEEHFGFQQVTERLHAYSSFYGSEERNNEEAGATLPFIKIVALEEDASLELNEANLTCTFYNRDRKLLGKTVGSSRSYDFFKNEGPLNYGPKFVNCPLIESERPAFVSLEGKVRRPNITLLEIIYPPSKMKYAVAACIEPLYNGFEDPLGLVEWIEFHLMMGVGHFTFYNQSVGVKTMDVLTSYKEVTLLQWNIPIGVQPVIGQLVQANDCSLRYRGVAKFVMGFDTDEFLIPSSNYCNYEHLFQTLLEKKEDSNQFIFLSKFSFNNWPKDDETYVEGNKEVWTKSRILTRHNFILGKQTKFVILPNRIVESGIHTATTGRSGTNPYLVPRQFGEYLHIRDCDNYWLVEDQAPLENGSTCLSSNYVRDVGTADRYASSLKKRMDIKLRRFGKPLEWWL